jgi:hypothetical protein
MLKLNAGFSRKVGEPDFGSRGASVNVELELDSNLIRDSEAFCAQIRNLFDLARQSVDEELAVDRTHPADSRSTRSTGPGTAVERTAPRRTAAVPMATPFVTPPARSSAPSGPSASV